MKSTTDKPCDEPGRWPSRGCDVCNGSGFLWVDGGRWTVCDCNNPTGEIVEMDEADFAELCSRA